jgi:hypothetical protein
MVISKSVSNHSAITVGTALTWIRSWMEHKIAV